MDGAQQPDNEQARLWNGPAGQAWVDAQAVLDRMFEPFEAMLADAATAGGARRVLDVGCGTGATTLAIARRLGETADCLGIDISQPMLALARARAERSGIAARFVHADAQSHAFAPGRFDAIVSRFGVMFFEDSVRAFANLRRAARGGAALRLLAWRSAEENPFMTEAERAAAPLLPNLPARRPEGPGQFAFADADRVRRILEESGWTEVDVRPLDVACRFPERELVRYLTLLGPVGRALQEADEPTRARVIRAARAAFALYVHGEEVRFTAACWTIGARAPSVAG